MFRLSFLLTLFFIMIYLWGCNENSSEAINEQPAYLLPLSIGNTWNYKLYNFSSDSVGPVIWVVFDKIIIEGKEYFLINSKKYLSGYYAARNEKDGLFFSYYDSANGFSSPIFFKYPAEDNETYQYKIPQTDSILTITVKKQLITVGNNSYMCYGYINNNFNPYFPFMYFSENIGLIRHKMFFYTDNRKDTSKYYIYDFQSKNFGN